MFDLAFLAIVFSHAGGLLHLDDNAPFARKISIAPARQSPGIAQQLHSTVTDEHFRLAAEAGDFGDQPGMQLPRSSRNDSQRGNSRKQQLEENVSFAEVVALFEDAIVAEEGFEPPTRGL